MPFRVGVKATLISFVWGMFILFEGVLACTFGKRDFILLFVLSSTIIIIINFPVGSYS